MGRSWSGFPRARYSPPCGEPCCTVLRMNEGTALGSTRFSASSGRSDVHAVLDILKESHLLPFFAGAGFDGGFAIPARWTTFAWIISRRTARSTSARFLMYRQPLLVLTLPSFFS